MGYTSSINEAMLPVGTGAVLYPFLCRTSFLVYLSAFLLSFQEPLLTASGTFWNFVPKVFPSIKWHFSHMLPSAHPCPILMSHFDGGSSQMSMFHVQMIMNVQTCTIFPCIFLGGVHISRNTHIFKTHVLISTTALKWWYRQVSLAAGAFFFLCVFVFIQPVAWNDFLETNVFRMGWNPQRDDLLLATTFFLNITALTSICRKAPFFLSRSVLECNGVCRINKLFVIHYCHYCHHDYDICTPIWQ